MWKNQKKERSEESGVHSAKGRDRGRPPFSFRKGSAKAQHLAKVSMTRKEQRKANRKNKKAKKHEFILVKVGAKSAPVPEDPEKIRQRQKQRKKRREKRKLAAAVTAQNAKRGSDSESENEADKFPEQPPSSVSATAAATLRLKEKEEQLAAEMKEVRKKRLLEENEEEERYIKMLSKRLKINKKTIIPASFREDGLDYVLEMCDTAVSKKTNLKDKNKTPTDRESAEEHSEASGGSENEEDSDSEGSDIDGADDDNFDEEASENDDEDEGLEADSGSESSDSESEKKVDGVWEDIYGRLRSSDGKVLDEPPQSVDPSPSVPPVGEKCENTNKYIPPMRRENQTKRQQIQKSLKGLLNRLAESNMHSIAQQIEDMYMKNSRNEMNESILEFLAEALVKPVLMPERIILEHVMVIAILHANVGTEVGAFFIQNFVEKFHSIYERNEIDDKKLENLSLLSSFMYHFKIVDSCLIYDLLNFLTNKFTGKDVELILTIFKSVGFRLRKDNPVALKALILTLQQKATACKASDTSSRVKFMLEIILAIRNNNMNKIPNYDPSYGEHLLKTLKSHLHKGNYVSEMKISMQDLLNAEKKGRWWIVGSAWNNANTSKDGVNVTEENAEESLELVKVKESNEKLMEKARSLGMNTDARRNIFCILMSAEDYLDAFEKLMRLGLKNQVERDIIHVIIYCCLQEKKFNPYYAFLVSKLCQSERRFILTSQYSIWDRLKDLGSTPGFQLTNLSRLIVHLINEKSLPLSLLKILDFADMDKNKLRFLKKTLSGVLLQNNVETLEVVFAKISGSEKLNLFRESLKLFMNHFLLKGEKELVCVNGEKVDMSFDPETLDKLKDRVQIAERAMNMGQSRVKL